jgi:hypothetical protein
MAVVGTLVLESIPAPLNLGALKYYFVIDVQKIFAD